MATEKEEEPEVLVKKSEDGKYQAEWFDGYKRGFAQKLETCKVSNILTMYSLEGEKKEKLFELPLDRYLAKTPCVAFMEHPETGETVFTCNVFHGSLALFNMKGEIINEMDCFSSDDESSDDETSDDETSDDELGEVGKADLDLPFKYANDKLKLKLCKIRGFKDKFHNKILYQDNDYLVIDTWFWAPVYITSIYKIKDMITKINYGPVTAREGAYDCNTNKVTFKGESYTIDRWYNNKKMIEIEAIHKMRMEQLHSDKCFLKKLFLNNIPEEDKEEATTYLAGDIKLSCVGKTSGSNIDEHLAKYLIETKDDSGDEICCEWFVNRLFHRYPIKFGYQPASTKESAFQIHHLAEINLGFTFGDKYEMIVYVPMGEATDEEKESKNWKPMWSSQNGYILDASCPWTITINKL